MTTACAADATKERLADLLTTPGRPDILLAVGHGLGLPAGHAAQRRQQGTLLCQDWPGPGTGPIEERHRFGADDVARLDGADLTGLITVLVACFGGGTPRHDGFRGRAAPSDVLAPRPFVAALPQALLGREGGALAAVGHVDRVWSYSFLWPGAGTQTATFHAVLAALRDGRPVGSALEYVSGRYAELAADLTGVLTERELGRSGTWLASRGSSYSPPVRAQAIRTTGTATTVACSPHSAHGWPRRVCPQYSRCRAT